MMIKNINKTLKESLEPIINKNIPKKIIPNFKIYCCVKSKPTIMPGPGVNALPIKIPSKIAIRTVEIGLLGVPKISIAKRLFIP